MIDLYFISAIMYEFTHIHICYVLFKVRKEKLLSFYIEKQTHLTYTLCMQNYIISVLFLYIITAFFELYFPAEQSQSLKGKIINIFYGTILILIGGFLVIQLYKLINFIIPVGPRMLPFYGLGFSLFITFLYLLVTDVIFYWYHRLQHNSRMFWELHELHHSDRELNATTSLRTYWLDRPIQTLIIIIPAYYIVGIDKVAIIVYPILALLFLFFTHLNVKIPLGSLTPVICGPQVHRIHHSLLQEHRNKNYAQYFPWIDIIFGSYYAPKKDEWPLQELFTFQKTNQLVPV